MIRLTLHIFLPVILFTTTLSSCGPANGKKFNDRVSLWRKDKIPYGSYVAFENLNHIFPDAYISTSDNAPAYIYDNYSDSDTTKADSTELKEVNAYIIIAPQVRPNTEETLALLSRATHGEHVFISAGFIGKELLDSMHLEMTFGLGSYANDSLSHSVYNITEHDTAKYTYPGFLADNYFTKVDEKITTILGTNSKGKPNFVKFDYNNGGSLIFNLSPFAFTNFFLLYKNNNNYYNKALSCLPSGVTYLEWDDYFHNSNSGGSSGFSSLGFLMKQSAFRWVIPLVIVLFFILFLIESKRRQRPVPVIPPLRNSSVDFVNTIGRLYYQQRDHKNLAQKMIAHFLDHVRTRYNLSTSVLDSIFIEKLSYKGGFDKEELADLIADINQININTTITEDELFMFSQKIEKFK